MIVTGNKPIGVPRSGNYNYDSDKLNLNYIVSKRNVQTALSLNNVVFESPTRQKNVTRIFF